MSRSRAVLAVVVLRVTFMNPLPGLAQSTADEFFIVSSVNPAKHQVVVKRPTEVTEVMSVNAETKYRDRDGRAIALGDLRAGDTVYVRKKPDANGVVAAEVRKGPMTLNELRKRYLQAKD